jgi:hypothetical protein
MPAVCQFHRPAAGKAVPGARAGPIKLAKACRRAVAARSRRNSISFLGQERPGVLKFGSTSIGLAADGQQFGVIAFRLLAVTG